MKYGSRTASASRFVERAGWGGAAALPRVTLVALLAAPFKAGTQDAEPLPWWVRSSGDRLRARRGWPTARADACASRQ